MESPAPRSPRSRSQLGGRTGRRPPSHLHSDCPPEPPDDPADSPSMGKRSVSLTTLQPTIIQPRMAQLETLEAKMASIEVSLSSTPRRRKNGVTVNSINLSPCIRAVPKEIAVKELESLRNALRDKENIIQSLKGQLTIPGLRLASLRNNGLTGNNNNNNSSNQVIRELSEVEKKQAEERLNRLKLDTDNKRLTIKNLKMALERLDITDNIDVRIQQAELEYQLGREELNLLTLLEETRALQLCLEESNRNSSDCHTLYSCVKGKKHVTLVAAEVTYDPKSPKFGASTRDNVRGLWIDWALEETGLRKEDRLLEVNGKIVLTKSREDLTRLLSAAPDPAQIVVLRKKADENEKEERPTTTSTGTGEVAALRNELEVVREQAQEAQKVKDGLRADNVRLTHRISYLEEQVSELLNRKQPEITTEHPPSQTPCVTSTVKSNQNVTNINISTKVPASSATNNQTNGDLQVFQKGPQVTALVANLPGLEAGKDTALPIRSKSSMSNVSNTHIPAPTSESYCYKVHRQKHRSSGKGSTQSLEQNGATEFGRVVHKKHHRCSRDYSSEIMNSSNVEHTNGRHHQNVENGTPRHSHHSHHHQDYSRTNSEKDYVNDISLRASKIVQDLTRHSKDPTLYEKHRQKCITASEKYNSDLLRHYNVRKTTSVLDFRSEVQIRAKYADSKSVDELDAIEPNEGNKNNNLRRLTESRSVKSLDFDSDSNSVAYITSNSPKIVDYTSEPLENNRKISFYSTNGDSRCKPRPTPPKKPIRLSLHKLQSNSGDTSSVISNGSSVKSDYRKPLKRNHKGEMPHPSGGVNVKIENTMTEQCFTAPESNGYRSCKESSLLPLKWTSFNQMK